MAVFGVNVTASAGEESFVICAAMLMLRFLFSIWYLFLVWLDYLWKGRRADRLDTDQNYIFWM